ncbi:aminotransferase class V-fold PLP-dependent enzyme [Streptomyces sp. TRM43335]|uniref:Aminotransferase class V-fold PLP-dependent enzyme n=1 Tax=Streptomyces taklimakanensis TaxID=2569853 RepID=A0A6G2B8T9_9ACTN|nr:aminotransferase class V-fold PLP-dependent enzyme [Streptomyces taklimakanensis]MTE18489.1 aminotransferase class V-fold PLP-dependent enzyme [Streptomyces taklimakanensis]
METTPPGLPGLPENEFASKTTYLDTASHGLLPARTVEVLHRVIRETAEGRGSMPDWLAAVERARARYARIVRVSPDRVALGTAVAPQVSLVAGALPSGAEVLGADGDFSSLLNPFAMRADLKLRTVPLEELAGAVRPGTALVAVSAVQSADGRIADLDAIAGAARDHGARTLVDTTQAVGWLPLDAGAFDHTVCGGYKWLLNPRGVSFLTVPEDGGGLVPLQAGWIAGERPWESCYGTVDELARSARRFDTAPAFLPCLGAERSLSLLEEVGPEAIGVHNRALAERFRVGAAEAGHRPVPGDSAIVAVPGLGEAAERLTEAGVRASVRAGNLRVAFHLYNTAADVDRLLAVLPRP